MVGDTVYGTDELRGWLEDQGRAYGLAVPRTHGVWTDGQQVEAHALVEDLPANAWSQLSAGEGSQGPCRYDWVCLALPYLARAGMAHWLLARRSVSDPAERAYYRIYGPAATSVERMARVVGRRWAIEVAFEEAKSLVGLDQYEARRWVAWHRHITLCLLAHACLVVARAALAAGAAEKGGLVRAST